MAQYTLRMVRWCMLTNNLLPASRLDSPRHDPHILNQRPERKPHNRWQPLLPRGQTLRTSEPPALQTLYRFPRPRLFKHDAYLRRCVGLFSLDDGGRHIPEGFRTLYALQPFKGINPLQSRGTELHMAFTGAVLQNHR